MSVVQQISDASGESDPDMSSATEQQARRPKRKHGKMDVSPTVEVPALKRHNSLPDISQPQTTKLPMKLSKRTPAPKSKGKNVPPEQFSDVLIGTFNDKTFQQVW